MSDTYKKPTPNMNYWYIDGGKVYWGSIGNSSGPKEGFKRLKWGNGLVAYKTKEAAEAALGTSGHANAVWLHSGFCKRGLRTHR